MGRVHFIEKVTAPFVHSLRASGVRERPFLLEDDIDGWLTEKDIIRSPVYTFIVDFEYAQPLAQLLQLEWGGDAIELPRFFPPDTWLPFYTWRMQAMTGTEDEWRVVACWWENARKRRARRDSPPPASGPPPLSPET